MYENPRSFELRIGEMSFVFFLRTVRQGGQPTHESFRLSDAMDTVASILAGLSAFILFLLSGMESLLQPSETWANPSRVLLVYDRLLLSGRLNIGMQIRVLQLQLSAR